MMHKIEAKPYRCCTCGYEQVRETNHYGKIYNTRCTECGVLGTWEFAGEVPEGGWVPPEWKVVRLGDLVKAR